jgi:hypothetical protein
MVRRPFEVLFHQAWTNLLSTSLILPISSSSATAASSFSASGRDFAKHRCAVPPFDIVEFFRGEGGKGVMTQLAAWGKKWST